MYSISYLCKQFNLSRSTLLYYDSIGILKASKRTSSNYRIYSDEDITKLSQICSYRGAGIGLKDIRKLLNTQEQNPENVLNKRLSELNGEIHRLRIQQRIILEMLQNNDLLQNVPMVNTESFVFLLKTIGLDEQRLEKFHEEFEKMSSSEHQNFLEFLGIDEEEIAYIREQSRNGSK
ncbi:MAG TPA: MerR family transcriptional regulator [Syntrophomonadaceae bacterium]|nr:MerR family transcriptional regulator [Syntrophomonadaceae bacterium]